MGSSSSTRTITVEEDAETGVVKVSEDLLKRMLGADNSTNQPIFHRKSERETRQYPSAEESSYNNTALLQLTSEQFKQAAEKVEAKFEKHHYVPICQKLQDDIMKCYAANPGKALNCSQEVKAFNRCVDHSRTSILTKKSQETVS